MQQNADLGLRRYFCNKFTLNLNRTFILSSQTDFALVQSTSRGRGQNSGFKIKTLINFLSGLAVLVPWLPLTSQSGISAATHSILLQAWKTVATSQMGRLIGAVKDCCWLGKLLWKEVEAFALSVSVCLLIRPVVLTSSPTLTHTENWCKPMKRSIYMTSGRHLCVRDCDLHALESWKSLKDLPSLLCFV